MPDVPSASVRQANGDDGRTPSLLWLRQRLVRRRRRLRKNARLRYSVFRSGWGRTTVAIPHRGSANTKLGVEKHGAGNIGHCQGARPKFGLSRRRPAPRFSV
jgi:hypothetical protein